MTEVTVATGCFRKAVDRNKDGYWIFEGMSESGPIRAFADEKGLCHWVSGPFEHVSYKVVVGRASPEKNWRVWGPDLPAQLARAQGTVLAETEERAPCAERFFPDCLAAEFLLTGEAEGVAVVARLWSSAFERIGIAYLEDGAEVEVDLTRNGSNWQAERLSVAGLADAFPNGLCDGVVTQSWSRASGRAVALAFRSPTQPLWALARLTNASAALAGWRTMSAGDRVSCRLLWRQEEERWTVAQLLAPLHNNLSGRGGEVVFEVAGKIDSVSPDQGKYTVHFADPKIEGEAFLDGKLAYLPDGAENCIEPGADVLMDIKLTERGAYPATLHRITLG